MIQRLAEQVTCWFFSRRELHKVVLQARDGQRAGEAVAAAALADNAALQREVQDLRAEVAFYKEAVRFWEQVR